MQLRQYLPNLSNERGFTLLELLVSSTIGLLITAMTISVTLSNRGIFDYDLARTQLNQNLRSALDIIGIDVRQGGENLPSNFPAIVLTNGAGTNPDELQVRRNLIDEVLKLCTDIAAGTNADLYFANTTTTAGCSYSGNTQNFNSWKTYRTGHGNTIPAYIYDPSTQKGEFFNYTGEVDGTTTYRISRSGNWTNDYTVGNTAAYILEEWHFKLTPDAESGSNILQVEQNNEDDPLNVIFGLTDFQITATLDDGTVKTSFATGSDWSTLQYLTITLSGADTSRGRQISKSVSSQFFPRNVLSH